MQEFIKKHNTGILVGLLSTMIFIYLLQPGLEFIGSLVVNIGTALSANYVDEIYSQISHLELMDFGFFFFVLMSFLMITIKFYLIRIIWRKKIEKVNSEEIAEPIIQTKLKLTMTFMLFIFLVFVVASISTKAYQLSIITSFKQHLRIISPYISLQEEKVIVSEWSLIQTKEDYELIYLKLNRIAEKNKVKLPDNSIYALDSL